MGGFFLASKTQIDPRLFCVTLIGIALVIASGCVFNNYIDRDIDSLMERTKHRVLVQGLMQPRTAIIYATILGALGLSLLYFGTNRLTTLLAIIGLLVYVVAYSLFLKRTSTLGTIIGAISGAIPPVVGYCAVTNQFDAAAVVLFAILFFWQMPHFYAISICRLQDYSAASIPILPVVKNLRYTKISMLVYTVLFAISAVLPSLYGYAGRVYFVVAAVLGLIWLVICIQGFNADNEITWARRMFAFSIIAITILSIMMIVKS